MRKLTLSIIAVVALAAPAAAQAQSQHVANHGVSATITYQSGKFNTNPNIQVKITRGGTLVYDAMVTGTCASTCTVPSKALHVVNLQGRPNNVVLELYTGGAHCCTLDEVYSPVSGQSMWGVDEWNFGDPGAALRRLSRRGHTLFLTADDRFAYRFTDFAESGLPIRILSFANHRFTNVTRKHRKLIRRDSKRFWKAYMSDPNPGRKGLIAAWAADQYNLRHKRHANRVLNQQVAKGRIHAGFVAHLKRFLKRHGY